MRIILQTSFIHSFPHKGRHIVVVVVVVANVKNNLEIKILKQTVRLLVLVQSSVGLFFFLKQQQQQDFILILALLIYQHNLKTFIDFQKPKVPVLSTESQTSSQWQQCAHQRESTTLCMLPTVHHTTWKEKGRQPDVSSTSPVAAWWIGEGIDDRVWLNNWDFKRALTRWRAVLVWLNYWYFVTLSELWPGDE